LSQPPPALFADCAFSPPAPPPREAQARLRKNAKITKNGSLFQVDRSMAAGLYPTFVIAYSRPLAAIVTPDVIIYWRGNENAEPNAASRRTVGQPRQEDEKNPDGAITPAIPVDRASHVQCAKCRGSGGRAARARSVIGTDEDVHYLAYLWRCSVCGHEWEDDLLRDLNAVAAEQARAKLESI